MNPEPTHDHVVIAGGSGFIGRSLARHFVRAGYHVTILSRSQPERPEKGVHWEAWDGKTTGAWTRQLEGARAVINLAGKNVDCRYTRKNLAEINESRVDSVEAIAAGIRGCMVPPQSWIQAGSLAIYGDAGETICTESTTPGTGIPVDTCLLWEEAFQKARSGDVRKVLLRISFVLGRHGGALERLAKLTRWYLGGAVGSGQQYISWIHQDDMNRMFQWAVEEPGSFGVYNATAPNAVTNEAFMRTLRKVMVRPWSPPTPSWLVRIGCWLLRTEPVLALTGRRGFPRRLLKSGFYFKHTKLETALVDLLSPTPASSRQARTHLRPSPTASARHSRK